MSTSSHAPCTGIVPAVRRPLHKMIDEGHSFDAVFALNDALALGVLRGLQEAGLRVPDDVAVLGFDNVDESQFAVPSLTTVDPGREEIAATAVDLLVERINEKGVKSPPRTVKASFSIVSRESTGESDGLDSPLARPARLALTDLEDGDRRMA